jgi:hypothetical protein
VEKGETGSVKAFFQSLLDHTQRHKWATLFVLIPLAAYGLFVMQQFQDLEEQHQRELGHAAQVLEDSVDNALVNVSNLTGDSGFLCQFVREQPYLDLDTSCSTSSVPTDGVRPKLEALPGGLGIVRGSKRELVFRFRVQYLLQELSFPEAFHSVALIDEKGRVLLNVQGQQPLWLRKLRWAEETFREPAFSDSPPLFLVDLKSVMAAGNVKPGFDELRGAVSRVRAPIGGRDYQVYLQPLRFQEAQQEGGADLMLVGFVPSASMLRESLAFDTYFVAVLLLLLVGLCLSYPFVKLWALHPKERYRIRDVLGLYLSTGALVALCTTVIASLDGYQRYQQLAGNALDELNSSLSQNVLDELRAARGQLVAYDRCEAGLELRASTPAAPVNVEQVAWTDASGLQLRKATPSEHATPLVNVSRRTYFRAVAQPSLWQVPEMEGDTAANVPFYFHPSRSITDGRFYSFLSIRSAGALCDAASNAEGQPAAAAVLTFSIFSLDQQPLPPGFGFALINREGTVLYHSDPRLSLRQNLFEDTGDSPRLRSLMLANREANLRLPYRGQPHRFLFRPLLGLVAAGDLALAGLYLATFQDISIGRYVAVQAFLSSMLWPQVMLAAWLMLALAGASWMSARRSGAWQRWLWTHPERLGQYRVAVASLLVMIAVALVLQLTGVSYAVALLLPAAATLTAAYATIWREAPGAPQPGVRIRTAVAWHRVLLLLLTLSLSLVPAQALWRILWGHELGKFVAYSRTQIAARATDLTQATSMRLSSERLLPEWRTHALNARRHFMLQPPPVLKEARGSMPGPDWIRRWHDRLSWTLPMRNETAIALRGQPSEPVVTDGARWWRLPRYVPALGCFALLILLVYWWTGWNVRHVLLTRELTGAPSVARERIEAAWSELTSDERHLLLQIAAEGIANPRQTDSVHSLATRGWLTFRPELAAASPEIEKFLLHPSRQQDPDFREAESSVIGAVSWQSIRKSLWLGVAVAAVFLFSTQPAIPADFLGLLPAVTAVLTGVVRGLDLVNRWISPASGQ